MRNIIMNMLDKKLNFLVDFKYKKITLLILVVILTYVLFRNQSFSFFINHLESLSYLGVFISGTLFSFGFSTPLAIGLFANLYPPNIFLASLIGGAGAVVSDMLIFKFIKFSFIDEFDNLSQEKPIKIFNDNIKNRLGLKFTNYMLYVLAGIIIASPLPDEVGVSILAGLTTIKPKTLAIISFIFNSIGIYLIFILSH